MTIVSYVKIVSLRSDIFLVLQVIERFVVELMTKVSKKERNGLQNSGMEGDSDLFDSMDSYFEDESHDEEAKVLMSMMKNEWEENWRDDSVYDYLGNREKETE